MVRISVNGKSSSSSSKRSAGIIQDPLTLRKVGTKKMSSTIVDTFLTADLIRYGWLTFEDGLHSFTTVEVVLDSSEYEQFRAAFDEPGRHPIAASSLLVCARRVNVPRRHGRVATSASSEFGAFTAFTDFMSLCESK
jgi:hypothetical protein